MKKEFGEVSREQARQLSQMFDTLSAEMLSLEEDSFDFDALNKLLTPWGAFYEIPLSHHGILACYCLGMDSYIEDVTNADSQIDEAFRQLETIASQPDDDSTEYSDEDLQLISAVTLSLVYQIKAQKTYSLSMSELVERVREGDVDSLFMAVSIDRSAVSCPSIAKRICIAQVQGDSSFMGRLAKAIVQTKPVKPSPKLDHFRFMLEFMMLASDSSITYNQLEDILVHDLSLYTNDSDYARKAFEKLIRQRNKRKAKK